MTYVYAYIRSKDSPTAEAGTPYYIGMGRGNRAYVKHGGNIAVPKNKDYIRMVATDLPEEDSWALERWLITGLGRKDLGTGILHNLTEGGDGPKGYRHTEDARRKIAESLKGNKRTVGNSNRLGKTHSFETKLKISLAKRKGKGRHRQEYQNAAQY